MSAGKTVLITGCSVGIGRATAELFQRNGWQVAATMRDPEAGKVLPRELRTREECGYGL